MAKRLEDSTDAKIVALYAKLAGSDDVYPLYTDASGNLKISGSVTSTVGGSVIVLNELIPLEFDSLGCSYTGTNLTGIIYNKSGATVATLTLAYDVSDNLTSVTRS